MTLNSAVSKWLPQIILASGIVLVIISTNPLRFVDNGQNLVVFSWFGGVQPTPLEPGFHVILPLVTSTIPFDVKNQALTWKAEDPEAYGPRLVALSRDGQEISSEVTLQFRIADPAKVYSTLGTDYKDRIAPIVRSVIASETAGFSAQDIYSVKRQALQTKIRERIATYLQAYGVLALDFLLRDVDFSPEFVKSIEAKTIAENQLQKKAFEIDQAREDSKTLIAVAQAEAGKLGAKADALTQNPEYLKVVKSGVLGDTLDTLITK